ncbi:phage tail protein I [Novosphingobium sp. SL115]|uniref:phage tail protein I n=1 Tax=Novosphingobium sp. SL115 TaxID=2995150 RepID=UPI002276F160|nr:phage tail protein I [Novosphingobium sp. SL115]MCY1672114.1 phage tail protein I [Novosphingobium sp. SL115]
MTESILPPNALPSERALELAMRAGTDLAAVGTLLNPATCPEDVLPFLARDLAISHWNSDWTVEQKRAATADAIPFHQRKASRPAVEEVLARFHPQLAIVEGWQANPRRIAHTFEVRAPAGPDGIDASFLTDETAVAIIRDVAAAKPLRSHFDFVHSLETQVGLHMAGGVIAGTMARNDYAAVHDTSRDWSIVWQTEDGEPIQTEDGTDFVEHD